MPRSAVAPSPCFPSWDGELVISKLSDQIQRNYLLNYHIFAREHARSGRHANSLSNSLSYRYRIIIAYLYAHIRATTTATRALGLCIQEVIDGVSLQGLLVDPGDGDVPVDHHAPLHILRHSEGHVLPGVWCVYSISL